MKITLAQINTIIGDLENNANKIINIIESHKGKSDVVIFPELSITGYPPLDLIERPGFCEEQLKQLNRIVKSCVGILVIVGYFRKNYGPGKSFFNSLAVIESGEIKHIYDKRKLPTYSVFDEFRYFEPGNKVCIYEYQGINLGLTICEDIWDCKNAIDKPMYHCEPIKETIDAGADIIISINASPSNVGKPEYRLQKFSKMANNYSTPIIYVNQVAGNDDIIFDGTSFVVDSESNFCYIAPSFEESCETIFFDGRYFDPINSYADPLFESNFEFYFKQITFGIKEYITKCGFKKAVVGSSGGVDSALVLALAVEALGKDNVIAITMPSNISSKGSVSDSEKLCANLGIKLYTYPISNLVDGYVKNFSDSFIDEPISITKENLQARIRGNILMAFSNQNPEFIVLNTGNKSECAVGYFTIFGDGGGCLGVISDLYKTEVWNLCKYYNKLKRKEIIPNIIIDKEPSAELYEGQKDTNSLPPYEVLDSILIPYIEGNEIDVDILESCKKTLKESGFININKILAMVDKAEFKRRLIPHTIRVHNKAWGAGRRLPIAQKYTPNI